MSQATITNQNKRNFIAKLLLLSLCSNALIISAFTQSRIHGTIMDSAGKPIVNANVLLLNSKDSVLVKGILTGDRGLFSFENIKAGGYLITATHTGIQPIYTKPFQVSEKQENIDMGTIRLEESSLVMANVTVTSKKPLYEQKIDRLIINVAASVTSAGSTALDILERSPGVIVNRLNNSLSINGKGGVIVMINGKRNYMDISALIQMLANMPSNNIERIEIITTPPANFDAEGDAGIINIVLKSNNRFGTNGSYSLTAGSSKGEQSLLGFNINHRKGKINLFGNYSFSRTHLKQVRTNYHAVTNAGKFMEDYSESNRHALVWQHDGQAGIDYEVGKKTFIGALVTVSYRHWAMDADNFSSVSADHNLDTTVRITNHELHVTPNYGINLNMQHTYKPDEKLTVNLDYLNYNDNNPNTYTNSYYAPNSGFLRDEQVESSKKTPLKFWITAADYSKKINKKINMEAGVKGSISKLSNDVNVATLMQNNWITDTSLSGHHDLHESIYASYSSLNIAITEKTSVKLGLRYEYTNSNLGSLTQKNIVNGHYGKFFPSFFFLHTINDNCSYNFSYSKRIWRPGFYALAPFVIFYDPKTFQTGNPALQPALTDALNAAYSFKNKVLSLSYSYTAHPIVFQPKIDEATNRLISYFTNAQSNKFFDINLSLPIRATQWWNMQNNFSGSWAQSNVFYKASIRSESKGYYLQSTQTLSLPKTFSVELSGYYSSKSTWGLYHYNGYGSLDVGIQKKFTKKKSSLSFNIRNILNTQKSKGYVDIPEQNLIQQTKQIFSYTYYGFTFSRSFGNDKVKEKRERTTGAEEEKGRAN
jgi:hypothetical protein